MSLPVLGLRDRKRVETRARLESAAVELVLEVGLDHATIDAISDRADVSPRTFFNYFDSKEDAVLGIRDVDVSSEELAGHVAALDQADAVTMVVSALFFVIGPAITDTAARESRMEIVRRHPQLVSRQIAQMTTVTARLTEAIGEVLRHDPRWGDDVETSSAEMILGLCFSAVRIAVREWMAAGSSGTPQELETRTVALIRQLTERIV